MIYNFIVKHVVICIVMYINLKSYTSPVNNLVPLIARHKHLTVSILTAFRKCIS